MDVNIVHILPDQNHLSLEVQVKMPLVEIGCMVKFAVVDSFHQMAVEFQLVVEQLGRLILLKAVLDEIVGSASGIVLRRLPLPCLACVGS